METRSPTVSWGQFRAGIAWDRLLERHSPTQAWKTGAAERRAARDLYLATLEPSFRHFTALPLELQVGVAEYLEYENLQYLECIPKPTDDMLRFTKLTILCSFFS